MKCEYGCGEEANFQLKNGKWCCGKSPTQCKIIRDKNSKKIKKLHKNGILKSEQLNVGQGWSKGLTKENDERIARIAAKIQKYPLEDILKGKYPHYSRTHLKTQLLKLGIKQNKCEICGFEGKWNNKEIIFYLDHINGINNDHRLKNLRIICPMCNTQLETFCSKNKNKPL